MKEYSPGEWRNLSEIVEGANDYDEELEDAYIEKGRYEYRQEWFEFLEALDKE